MIRRTQIKRTRIKPKPKRDPMPAGRRMEVYERDGWACRYCERPVTYESGLMMSGQVHHIKHKSQGVDHSAKNLILLCRRHHELVHFVGNRRDWLWIIGPAETAEFVNTNPKQKVQS